MDGVCPVFYCDSIDVAVREYDGKRERVYLDMDNVLVDFASGIARLDEPTRKAYEGHLDDVLHKRIILSHQKDLLKGDFLIDDRPKHGAATFEGKWIPFGSEEFPDWEAVLKYFELQS